jgi:ATP-dependent Lon protease
MTPAPGPIGRLDVPVLPLREAVAFPHATRSFNVGRNRSRRLIEMLAKAEGDRTLVLVAQRDPGQEDPSVADLETIGTLGRLIHMAPAGRSGAGYVVVVAGTERVRVLEETARHPFLRARVEPLADVLPAVEDPEFLALRDSLRKLLTSYVERAVNVPPDAQAILSDIEDPALLSDVTAAMLPSLSPTARQLLLATTDVRQRLRRLVEELVRENEKLDLELKIQSDIRDRLVGAQRELLLREQLKAIERELGQDDPAGGRLSEIEAKIEESGMPDEVKREARRELGRLRQIPAASPEYTVALTYLDWVVALPWNRPTGRDVDMARAQQILDEDHYDITAVKARILEFLAVMHLRAQMRGPILCFVGPPGVGKTSLGRSIARALGRKFVRISLGGMSDEAELRGHRRTYIGALPGQIVQGLRRAGASDPVFMLDEIDKLGRDFRGDPAAALLEVLDPEQNFSFRDRFLDVPFDLSRVLFIATANILDPIPPALLDRMEVLQLSGYAEEEKLQIALRFLVAKQVHENGLDDHPVHFTDEGLLEMARHYTREAGVRALERQIAAVCRKQARRVAEEGPGPRPAGEPPSPLVVTPELVRRELGVPRFRIEIEIERRTLEPGVAVGLAWTPSGGDLLFIEARQLPDGRGRLTLTGQLGEVMQESARAATTWLRVHGVGYGILPRELRTSDLHVHVPAGAVPKDGPSAGVAIATALASALTGRPTRPEVAMTGEITLSGQVLPVGGIREKVLAAKRSGISEVVLPQMNEADVMQDIAPELRAGLVFHFVRTVDDALEQALGPPGPRRQSAEGGAEPLGPLDARAATAIERGAFKGPR